MICCSNFHSWGFLLFSPRSSFLSHSCITSLPVVAHCVLNFRYYYYRYSRAFHWRPNTRSCTQNWEKSKQETVDVVSIEEKRSCAEQWRVSKWEGKRVRESETQRVREWEWEWDTDKERRGERVKREINVGWFGWSLLRLLLSFPSLLLPPSLFPPSSLSLPLSSAPQFLFHGSRADAYDIIFSEGLDHRVAQLSGAIGAGVYFAENSSTSNAYVTQGGGKRKMMLCRVTCKWHCLRCCHCCFDRCYCCR